MVMEKLGISGDLDGDKLLDRLGTEDIENLFVDTEPSLEEVKEAFDVFDENNDGYIDAEELEKILCKLGIVEVPKGECQRMITVFDDNGDGRIEFREFIKLVENMFG
ncbi:hypothetical protein RJ640_010628 [Escallonia rubra]|uniref:EF-hand domain-containing protein n=1 Tax=Escallonia rubra TaxID=112253 RepID=A0AA88RRI7_9ASTE|nr:hypothetical protein RJ640_010628 [Escallonia rubra]